MIINCWNGASVVVIKVQFQSRYIAENAAWIVPTIKIIKHSWASMSQQWNMMMSSNGNIFHVTGPSWGETIGTGGYPSQKPLTWSFDVFFVLHLNKRLSKQWWGWWFVMPSCPLWHHCNDKNQLTHWGRVRHICVGKLTIIGSDNGLSPGRRQAITWTNAGILLIEPLGTNFSEIFIESLIFSFKKIRLKVLSTKWRPFCLGLNVLKLPWSDYCPFLFIMGHWVNCGIVTSYCDVILIDNFPQNLSKWSDVLFCCRQVG